MLRLILSLAALSPACSGVDPAGEPVAAAPPTQAGDAAEGPLPSRNEFDHSYAAWTALLAKHVRKDAVDYEGLLRDRSELDQVLARLARVSPSELEAWSEPERFAFWINVYNAFCLKLVVDNYPVDSIRDLGGALFGRVWDKEYIPLAAHHPEDDDDPLSLNDVEHGILRVRFEDARLHAAVNCASRSCPPLRNEAFVAARLDEQLDEQMRAFVADETRNKLLPDKKRARVSAIFDWFAQDFERDAGSVRAYLARFAPGKDTGWLEKADLDYLDYDWSLNDAE